MTTVHFICRGNANRSLMAEAYLKSLKIPHVAVISSGTVADAHRSENEPRIPWTLQTLKNHGISQFAKRHPEQLTQERINTGDITVFVNQIAADEAKRIVSLPKEALVWDVDDFGEVKQAPRTEEERRQFSESTFQQLANHINMLANRLRQAG